ASRAWPGLWLSHDGASSSAGPRPHHHSGVSTRMTLFGLVRHGQTDYNRQHLFQGSSDIPLNDTGREQAHQALATATPVAWDAVITSPLARAQETGRIIASDHSLSFEGTDPRLVEIDWGQAEGRSVAEMEARYPGRSFPGREDLHSVVDRACSALDELDEALPPLVVRACAAPGVLPVARRGRSVLLVAPPSLDRRLISGVTGQHGPCLPNGALSLLKVEDDTWSLYVISGRQVEPISAALS